MKIKPILYLLTFTLLAVSCNDSSTEPGNDETGTISGTITFVGENCPAANLSVGIYTNWYPQGPPVAYTPLNSENIDNGSYIYSITEVPIPGTYAATFVAWEDVDSVNANSGQNQQYTLGLYGSTFDFTTGMLTTPTPITLTSDSSVQTGVDITASCSLIP